MAESCKQEQSIGVSDCREAEDESQCKHNHTDENKAGIIRHIRRLLGGPVRWLVLTGWLAMVLFAFLAFTQPTDVGDTWIALACGRHFVNHGVDTVDPFSSNSLTAGPTEQEVKTWPNWAQWIVDKLGLETVRHWHPTGWINQNWLSHVLFYWLTTTIGSEQTPYFNALLYLKFAFYLLTVLCLYRIGRALGAHPALAAWFTCFAMFVGRTYTGLRPADFSNLLAPTFMLILVLASYRNILYVWLIVPMAVLWGNLHGGYIYIFIMLVPFIGLHFITALPRRWGMWIYSVLGWLFLCAITLKFSTQSSLSEDIPTVTKVIFYTVCLLGIGGLVTVLTRRLSDSGLYSWHVLSSLFVFVLALAGLYAKTIGLANLRELTNVNGYQIILVAIFAGFLVLGTILNFRKQYLVSLSPKALCHVVGAYMTALIAIVLFNPFHLTNLTHVYAISLSEEAPLWRTINEWRPVFDRNIYVGDVRPFLVMLVVNCLVLFAWIITQLLAYHQQNQMKNCTSNKHYQWPRFDISLLAIAILTMIMAVRSRRFISIAAFVSCPILAVYVGQIFQSITVIVSLRRRAVTLKPAPQPFAYIIARGSIAFVVCLGVASGFSFHRYFIAPRPNFAKDYSVFERILGSYRQPFDACTFIKQNKVKGMIFNVWEEGGFIMWSQDPHPDTGKTPLQVSIDGRAQAAYSDQAYQDFWDTIFCIPIRRELRLYNHEPNGNDWGKIGLWVDERFKQQGLSVALLSIEQHHSCIIKALKTHTDWRTVFIDDKHILFVDVTTQQGQGLFSGITTGDTVYPNDLTRQANLAHHLLKYGITLDVHMRGLAYAKEALHIQPSLFTARQITKVAANYEDLMPEIRSFCQDYLRQFETNKDEFKEQNGLTQRFQAAIEIADFLHYQEQPCNSKDATETILKKKEEYTKTLRDIISR